MELAILLKLATTDLEGNRHTTSEHILL